MLIDGITIPEGSEIENLSVPIGIAFPSNANVGELFYKTDEDILYVYSSTGPAWLAVAKGPEGISKWIIDTADKIYHIDDVGIGATPLATKKLYVLGDAQIDGDLIVTNDIKTGVAATATNASHMFVETGSDGYIRKQTMAESRQSMDVYSTSESDALAAKSIGVASLYHNGTTSISNSFNQTITIAEFSDPDNLVTVSSNIAACANAYAAGYRYYKVYARLYFQGASGGVRICKVSDNTATEIMYSHIIGSSVSGQFVDGWSNLKPLVSATTVKMLGFQNSGGSISYYGGEKYSTFTIEFYR